MTVSLVKRGWLRILSAASIFLPPLFALQSETAAPTFFAISCQSFRRDASVAIVMARWRRGLPLETYRDVQPFAAAIAAAVQKKNMPPWFADPCCGHFSNDPSLTKVQIETISRWADAHPPAGSLKDAPPAPQWTGGWKIEKPDLVLQMPVAKQLPAHGDIPYQYVVDSDWLQAGPLGAHVGDTAERSSCGASCRGLHSRCPNPPGCAALR